MRKLRPRAPDRRIMTSPIAQHSSPVETAETKIYVQKLSERITAWPEDDWSGISDLKQRRRLQNRLNQRARRLRERKNTKATSGSETSDSQNALTSTKKSVSRSPTEVGVEDAPMVSDIDNATGLSLAAVEHVHILEPDSINTKRILQQVEAMANTQYMLGSPRTDMLLHLIQFNFIKALIQNTRVLGLTSKQLDDDAISPFNMVGQWQYDVESALPSSLRPTVIQRTVVHHPWLDLFPFPDMRDNLISAGESYDETQLCLDMKGRGNAHADHTGIIVWRDPWDPSGWEVTEPFARSWGWVLRGCLDLYHSTNCWRARRNERPLFRMP